MMQTVHKCPICGRFLKAGAICPVHKKKGQAQKVETARRKPAAGPMGKAHAARDKWQPKAGVVCATCGEGTKDKAGIVDCGRFKYRIGAEYAKTGAACRT